MKRRVLPIITAGLCIAGVAGFQGNSAAQSEKGDAGPEPVLDHAMLMEHILTPAAFQVWESVGYVMDESGAHMNAPETEEAWEDVADGAAVIAESRNLLLISGRAVDRIWVKYSVALSEAGLAAFEAAEARDPEAIFKAGSRMTEACQGCQDQYGIGSLE